MGYRYAIVEVERSHGSDARLQGLRFFNGEGEYVDYKTYKDGAYDPCTKGLPTKWNDELWGRLSLQSDRNRPIKKESLILLDKNKTDARRSWCRFIVDFKVPHDIIDFEAWTGGNSGIPKAIKIFLTNRPPIQFLKPSRRDRYLKTLGIVLPPDTIKDATEYSKYINVRYFNFDKIGSTLNLTAPELPTPPNGLTENSRVKSLVGGAKHTIAIYQDNSIYTFGNNTYGQIGDGSTTESTVPTLVNKKIWKQADASANHSLAIDIDGRLHSWGQNNYGQLGDNSKVNKSFPTYVKEGGIGHKTWQHVSTGPRHSLGIDNKGYLFSWGNNSNGQLGIGSTAEKLVPTQIGSSKWAMTACGDRFSAGIDATGYLWAWGYNSGYRLGDNTTTQRTSPVKIGGTTKFKQVACFEAGGAALDTSGYLWTWGDNSLGQLGNGGNTVHRVPTRVGGTMKFKHIACGNLQLVAITEDGYLYVSGKNVVESLAPNHSAVANVTSLKKVSDKLFVTAGCGEAFMGAIDEEGYLFMSGAGSDYQLGDDKGLTRQDLKQVFFPIQQLYYL